jgi:hypothetical protein
VQNISVKGVLSNCAGEESSVTGGKYEAHLKTTEAVTCAALTSSAADEGTIDIKWSPKGSGKSKGTFSMPISELPTSLSGMIESGPFTGGAISGTVTESYSGGSTCGESPPPKPGKKPGKKPKKVDKGTFTGTLTV